MSGGAHGGSGSVSLPAVDRAYVFQGGWYAGPTDRVVHYYQKSVTDFSRRLCDQVFWKTQYLVPESMRYRRCATCTRRLGPKRIST